MKFILPVLLCFVVQSMKSQPVWMPAGKHPGVESYSSNFQDAFSASYHPGALGTISQPSIGAYAENRFLLKALALYSLQAAIPLSSGAANAGLLQFGNKYWRQQQLLIGYGLGLGKRTGIGVQFLYANTKSFGYPASGEVGFKLGAMYHTKRRLHIGCMLFNTSQKMITYALGLGFEASKDCLLAAELFSISNYFQGRVGVIYRVATALALLAGTGAGVQHNYAGMNIYWHSMKIGMVAGFHPQLGITPSLSVLWQPTL
ncbi:hypothetical protein SAMN05660909_01481 [Chitinophaga terrae (ex Kim and Jung 2007)]|uniref:Type IX secretion system membrane protein PorP/SprF n=1 Tax=Chitinophaga terrae (ex Kim and Jung 2007) TaxID=408074 RepID=A0A1H4A5S7_9BACT|nr:hypothetical protein [Chitinophaga terrae (ex Kim and Jung 2007)]SEA31168.1 hypothetical protein SAMN05660909_01481 [Chitinophaga terrae (ex Kim and Jung 2007)]